MMKFTFIFLLLLIAEKGFSQADTLFIKGRKFVTVKQAIKTEYNIKDTVLKIFSIENGKRRRILSHYLFQYGADCNNEFRDIGTVEVRSDKLLLKTQFLQKGFDPIPKSRLRIYRLTTAGKLIPVSDITK